MAFLQNSLLHPLSGLFSWLFGQRGKVPSLTFSAPALQPQRAFVMGAHACHLHSILLDTLQWRPTGVGPGALIR